MRVVNNVQGIGSADTYLIYKPSGTQYHACLYGSILVASSKEKEIKMTTVISPACTGRTSGTLQISQKNKPPMMSLLFSVRSTGNMSAVL